MSSCFGPLPYWLRKGLSLNLLLATQLVQSVRRLLESACLCLQNVRAIGMQKFLSVFCGFELSSSRL